MHSMDHSVNIKMQLLVFDDLKSFSKAIEAGEGFIFDFASLTELKVNSLLGSEQHLIVNIKSSNDQENDNLLFLTKREAFLFTKKMPDLQESWMFADIMSKPFGCSTILTYLTLKEVKDSYEYKLETLRLKTHEIENNFESGKYKDFISEFKSAEDGVKDFYGLVIKFQDTKIKEVETSYISVEYSELVNQYSDLLSRYQFLYQIAREICRIVEMEENIRERKALIRRLNATIIILVIAIIVVILLILYFVFRAILNISWIYPMVDVSLIVIAAICATILTRKLDPKASTGNLRHSKPKKK